MKKTSEAITSPRFSPADFWCDVCREDKHALGVKKVVALDMAFYEATCSCGSVLRRHITHKKADPYFVRSHVLRADRQRHRSDLLQPGEYGFRTKYGLTENEKKELEALEKNDHKEWKKKRGISRSFIAL